MRDRSYQWLKDATSFGLISDNSTEIRGSKYWPILHTGRMADIAFFLLIFVCKLANDGITSGQNLPISLEIVTFGQETRLQFYLPAVPGLIASNFLCQITQ